MSGRLIKTRESFAAHAAARRGNEFKSVSERLPTKAGALVTPSCTVSAVTTPPALYYESNLSRRARQRRLVRGQVFNPGANCLLSSSPGKRGRTILKMLTANEAQREICPTLFHHRYSRIREPDTILPRSLFMRAINKI